MENNKNNIDFLEELKQDYQLVTKKLESQRINNERLLRTVMKNKIKDIHRYSYLQLFVFLPLVLVSWLFLYAINFISLPLTIFTIVMAAADIFVDFRINKVMGKDWLEENLLASRSTLLKMKQLRTKRFLYSIPILLVWLGFLSYDFYLHLPTAFAIWLIGVGFFGGLLGFGIAYGFHRKEQRINDELIEEIDRFKNEEVSLH